MSLKKPKMAYTDSGSDQKNTVVGVPQTQVKTQTYEPMIDVTPKKTTPVQTTGTADTPVISTPKVVQTEAPQAVIAATPASEQSSITKPAGVDAAVWAAVTADYQQDPTVSAALDLLKQQQQRVLDGKTSYSEETRKALDMIRNQKEFSYDATRDPLFQQMLSGYQESGRQAMKDAIGKAAGMTGGYASSYAEAVGQQQQDAYLQAAYNNLPSYYQAALTGYQAERDRLRDNYSLLAGEDEREYGRLKDAYSVAQAEADRAYNAFRDTVSQNSGIASMQNSDYWTQKNYDEQVRKTNASIANQNRQYELEKAKAAQEATQEAQYKPSSKVTSIASTLQKYKDDVEEEDVYNIVNGVPVKSGRKTQTVTTSAGEKILKDLAGRARVGEITEDDFNYLMDMFAEEISAVPEALASKILRGNGK